MSIILKSGIELETLSSNIKLTSPELEGFFEWQGKTQRFLYVCGANEELTPGHATQIADSIRELNERFKQVGL